MDNLGSIVEDLRKSQSWLTKVGILCSIYIATSISLSIIKNVRLYVWSQIVKPQDTVSKYGKWAVVTGATDGIGLAIAQQFARRGHSIIAIGRNDKKLSATKELLESEQNVGQVISVKIDLSDASVENFDRIVKTIEPAKRDIGILVNNAGYFCGRTAIFSNYQIEELLSMIDVNATAPVHMTRMILPAMLKRRRGLVLNVSSSGGLVDSPFLGLYGTTKTFMNSMTRRLQYECSPYNVDLVCLTPGPVNTKLFSSSANPNSTPFIISPSDYAKTSINALRTGVKFYSGCLRHELIIVGYFIMDRLGLMVPMRLALMKLVNAKSDLKPKDVS